MQKDQPQVEKECVCAVGVEMRASQEFFGREKVKMTHSRRVKQPLALCPDICDLSNQIPFCCNCCHFSGGGKPC